MDATRVSLAYRYHNPSWDLELNRSIYGDDHNVEGIGANMTVWLEVSGEKDPKTKLVLPEKSLDPYLKRVKELLDHRCLFEVEPWFETQIPTLENIADFVRENIWQKPPPGGQWHRIIVEENASWRMEIFNSHKPSRLTHSFAQGPWRIQASIEGEVDMASGLLIRRAEFYDAIKVDFRPDAPESYYRDLKARLPSLAWMRIENALSQAWEFSNGVAF